MATATTRNQVLSGDTRVGDQSVEDAAGAVGDLRGHAAHRRRITQVPGHITLVQVDTDHGVAGKLELLADGQRCVSSVSASVISGPWTSLASLWSAPVTGSSYVSLPASRDAWATVRDCSGGTMESASP